MIKAAVIAVPIVIIMNLLAAAGFVGWMYQTGRLNSERIDRVVAIFTPTIAEEEKLKAEAETQAALEADQAAVDARMAKVSAGGQTLSQMFEEDLVREESGQQVATRVNQEAQQLRSQMRNFQAIIDKQQADLDADRKEFEDEIQRQKNRVKEEDFKQTVLLMESLEPKAVKGVFDNLIQAGQMDEVIEYLAAMNTRKSSAVLAEYKGPENAVRLTELLTRLDHRRSQPLDSLSSASAEGDTP